MIEVPGQREASLHGWCSRATGVEAGRPAAKVALMAPAPPSNAAHKELIEKAHLCMHEAVGGGLASAGGAHGCCRNWGPVVFGKPQPALKPHGLHLLF